MRKRWRHSGRWFGAIATGGLLYAVGSGPACQAFAFDQLQSTTDFCFLFDCQQGAIGGLIDFCSQSILEEELFTDCPQFTDDTNP